ncbi:MAG: molybdopterin-binding protein [Candidatus Bathyarchaeia archaeon]
MNFKKSIVLYDAQTDGIGRCRLLGHNKEVTFELLFIGNELLTGKVLNTNSQWLARHITSLGGTCRRMTVVGDDLEEISGTIKEILKRSPKFLITSGGLGPTYDDMTLEGVAKALGRPIEINEEALSWVNKRYEDLLRRGLIKPSVASVRAKMAKLPLGSRPLRNPVGTAPGVLIEAGATKIICLPGVPEEMEAIFEETVKEEISKELSGLAFVESGFVVKGLGESFMAPIIEEAMRIYAPYVYIKSHPKHGTPELTVEFTITSRGADGEVLRQKNEEACRYLKGRFEELGGKILPLEG